MEKKLLKTSLLIALLIMSFVTHAIPADPKPIIIKQPNGKTLTFYLKGDERMSWAVTTDGYTLLTNAKGNLVYAIQDDRGSMVASDILAADSDQRTIKDLRFLKKVKKNIAYSDQQKEAYQKLWSAKIPTKYTQPLFPAKGGKKNLLVVLVNFSDLSFTTDKSIFENMCMQDNYNGTGSIRQYYYAASGGQLDLQIDVVGPVTLPNSMEYYGGHETKIYNGEQYTVHDKNTKAFVTHAVQKVASLVNMKKYDNDNDGIVDDIAFIYAGTPESSTKNPNELWPHSSEAQMTTLYNGVKVNRYTCSAEKPVQAIGTFCHEFGHALGLPDWYDTDYDKNGGTSVTVGGYSLMCDGAYNNNQNTPPLWSAIEQSLVGWIDTIINVDGTMDSVRLPIIDGTKDTAYRIFVSGTEFFMLEGRKKQGFDAYLPGEGLIVYHGQMNKINAWVNYGENKVSINPNDRGWFIEPADGLLSSTNTGAATFPGTKNITCFLTPKTISGTTLDNMKITDIHKENDSVLMFNFNSNKPYIQTGDATNKLSTSVTVSAKVVYKKPDVTFIKKGFVYSLQENCPYVASNTVEDTTLSDVVNINAVISGLTNYTDYYYKAFVTDNSGVMHFGNIKKVKTSSGLGYTSTNSATNIDSTSATLNGSLYFLEDGTFTEKGFVYVVDNADVDPTVDGANNSIKVTVVGSDLGDYAYDLTNLQQGTTYYYRSYVTNIYGTTYGDKKSFQTLYPAIKNNVISASQQICLGTTPEELTGEEPAGAFGEFTYKWEQQSGYGSWHTAEGVHNTASYQPAALTTTTNYRRVAISKGKYENISNIITVEVFHSNAGNIVSSKKVYQVGEEVKLTLVNYSGTVLDWLAGTDTNHLFSIGNAGLAVLKKTFNEKGPQYFQVKVQAGQCESVMSSIKSITITNSSVADVESLSVFDVIPNPTTNGRFTVNSGISKAQSLVITNTLGQVVYSEKDVDLQNKNIELKDVEDGTYIINVMFNDNLMTKKIIVKK
ncbi:MAG: M6 family metalloprotease domain-containing protein [Bacteroidales bacterium]